MVFQVLYTDDYLMVINKPAGLVTESAETVKQEALTDYLQKDFGIKLFRGGLVHRLDKDTSGVILVAKLKSTLEYLQKQFKDRKVKKEYWALVHGQINGSGKIEGGIGRNPENREKFIVLEEGKEAVTKYEPLKQFTIDNLQLTNIFEGFNKIQMRKLQNMNYQYFTLLKCLPETGRTHQIRVHLKYINHPIVSDEKYVGRKMVRYDKRWCPRLFLHAQKIGFYHPVKGWMEIESPLPDDLKKALRVFDG